jgi:hypothetical protein
MSAGSPVADEQLGGVGGAGEPAHGVAGQAELGGDRGQGPTGGEQPVDIGVPAAGPLGDPDACGRGGRVRGARLVLDGRAIRAGRCGQVLAVPRDCPLDGLAQVVPQVPPVGDRPTSGLRPGRPTPAPPPAARRSAPQCAGRDGWSAR